MSKLPHIMSRVLNQPLMMDPAYARTFFAALSSRLNVNRVFDLSGEVEGQEKLRIRAEAYSKTRDRDRPYRVENGIAVLPVDGTLVNKYGHVQPYSGMTGYDGILARAADAFNDRDIRGVFMDNDTPGGDAAGCFDCTRTLRQMAADSGKPLWSLAYDMNCSGGMALASAADRRLITSTGYAGSIGVIMAHANHEKQMEQAGIDITLIYAGAHKADGNPYQALPDETYERFLSETESLRQEFAELVAENMGLPLQTVLATEALSYRGAAAVNAGLADQVVNGNQAIRIFSDYLSSQGSTISVGARMSTTDNTASVSEQTMPAAQTAENQNNAAIDDAAQTEHQTAAQSDDSRTATVTEERARISAILNCEEAEGRSQLANHFAMNTDMTVDQAKAALAAAPTEKVAGNQLDALMTHEQNPVIGVDAEQGEVDDEVSMAVGLYNQTRGIKA